MVQESREKWIKSPEFIEQLCVQENEITSVWHMAKLENCTETPSGNGL